MKHRILASIAVLSLFATFNLFAQEPERTFCDDADPRTNCPGDDCLCTDDNFELVFEGQLENSIWEYETFDAEAVIPGRVIISAVSEQIRGYSFGVAHETEDINPLLGKSGLNIGNEPAVDPALAPDTASLPSQAGGFLALRLMVEGGVRKGFILAVVLNFSAPTVLPVGRQIVVNCNYALVRDVGPAGTLLRFTEELGDPPTQVVLTIDKLSFPDMTDRDEGNCIDGLDNDFDGLVDRDDPDCVVRDGVSRVPRLLVEGLVRQVVGDEICDNEIDDDGDGDVDCDDADCADDPVCPVDEICDNEIDDDGDGDVDCDDADCADDPVCVVTPEICDNEIDDDEDGDVDCDDADCADDPVCVVTPEICDNEIDDDEDGDVDCDDADCAADPACIDCPDWALYFGPTATTAAHAVAEDGILVISMRNATASRGYQFGCRSTTAGDTTTWEFTGELGGTAETVVPLLIADDSLPTPSGNVPEAGNTATSSTDGVLSIATGAASSGFPADSDILLVDFVDEGNGVGGKGFTVAYVTDVNDDGTDNVIAATGTDGCPANEIVIVELGAGAPFNRGDVDGSGLYDVLDAIIIVQFMVGNISEPPFDCDKAFDVNDSGDLEMGDPLFLLMYSFMRGSLPSTPFRECGMDATADDLDCNESNCQ